MAESKNVLRALDDEARHLAITLLRATPYGTLATLAPADGWPSASLVTVATDIDGAPILLISSLSGHTPALQADARCSLLLSRIGRGDPLAHPRISLQSRAVFLERDSPAGRRARRRFLARHHKASLYADFADFAFVRLEPDHASLNGGFGKAYRLGSTDLMCPSDLAESFATIEASAVAHMNDDHPDAVALIATRLAGADPAPWQMTGIDPQGIDLFAETRALRIRFEPPLQSPGEIHARLIGMTQAARAVSPPGAG